MQTEPMILYHRAISVKSAAVERAASLRRSLSETSASWSLARQFGTCATLVMLPAMLLIGLWVSSRIKESVIHSTGTSAALYMENFVEPLVQELATDSSLSSANVSALGGLLAETSLGQRVMTFKIWSLDGLVLASSRPELVGKSFPPSSGLIAARTGRASAEFDHLKDVENELERNTGVPLLEVYIPLRERGSERIIGVAEFYEKAYNLRADLNRAWALSWVVVAVVTLSMLSALFAIVRRGSETIDRQQAALESRVSELTELRARSQDAFARATESNESYMRRLGADLHDGPAQLISLALLRLGTNPDQPTAGLSIQPETNICVRQVLADALRDIRNLAVGFAVPEIEALSLGEAIQTVVVRHERLTGTSVAFHCAVLPNASHATRLCAYRFVQEGLSNAFRHAGGVGQTVRARADGDSVQITVADSGDNACASIPTSGSGSGSRLGLRALADRIESLGGTLDVVLRGPDGTRLTARLPIIATELPK